MFSLFSCTSQDISAWSSVTIAAVAVVGPLAMKIKRFLDRAQLRILKSDRYDYHNPKLEVKLDDGMDKDYSTEYYVPIENFGNSKASNVEVVTDCILKKNGDWDSLQERYFGMPLRFCWQSSNPHENIPCKGRDFVRLLKFSQNVKGEDLGNVDVESAIIMSLCISRGAECPTALLQLSVGTQMTFFVRMAYRADEEGTISSEWLYIHWDGKFGAVEASIRKASKEEVAKVTERYNKLLAAGKAK